MTKATQPGGVSILIPSWNGREHLSLCLPTLLAQRDAGVATEIVVLDNGSNDDTATLLADRFPAVRVERSDVNLGFAAGCNLLAERASHELLLFVNNDTRAEAGWVAAMMERLAMSPPDVAAVAGRIVDWEGGRLDFGRGILTFDGHALALDQGRQLAEARVPESGDELLFGCGGNLLVRRGAFGAVGGFDPAYFAYFEDVDLGWRLWAAGLRVIACAEGVVRHRTGATSTRLGNRRRGLLFERNALWTMLKNLEPGLRDRLLPAILLVYLSRLSAMVGEETPLGIPGTGGAGARQWPSEPVLRRLERHGAMGLLRRGGARALRRLAELLAPSSPELRLASDRTAAQIGALRELFDDWPRLESRRAATQALRKRSDREIFARFPLWIVPAYPGDAPLFESAAFRELLPQDLRFESAELRDVLATAAAESVDAQRRGVESRLRY